MIILANLLIGIGIADIARAHAPARFPFLVPAIAGVVGIETVHLLDGTNPFAHLASVAILLAWLWVTARASFAVRKAGVVGLGVVVLLGLTLPLPEPTASTAMTWFASLDYPALSTVSFEQALMLVALVFVLIETANVVVRTVLELPDDEDAPRTTRGRLGARRPLPAPLKGGRLIGPLERIFLFALALAGQFTAIGAIVAAKGIVRFPELSRDNSRGANAELFLVGSFTSWALVLGAVLIARLGG